MAHTEAISSKADTSRKRELSAKEIELKEERRQVSDTYSATCGFVSVFNDTSTDFWTSKLKG
jgi:hypothetical protein